MLSWLRPLAPMDPPTIRSLTPSQIAAYLGLDLIEAVQVVPFEKQPFERRGAPPGQTAAQRVVRLPGRG